MQVFLIFIWTGLQIIGRSLADSSGDCENRENPTGRNFIHNETIEVDPCGPPTFLKCLKPEVENCTTAAINGDDSSYEFIVGEYDPKAKAVRFALIIQLISEFYVYVHSSDGDGNITDNSTKLGYFDDSVFPMCNSYACCDPAIKTKPNVARRCPYSGNATTRIPERDGFYGISYLWYPPRGLKGYIIFVADISDSEALHYERITSKPVEVDTIVPNVTTVLPTAPVATVDKPAQPSGPPPPPTTPPSPTKQNTTEVGGGEIPGTTTPAPKKRKHKKHKTTTTTAAPIEKPQKRKHKKHKKDDDDDDDGDDDDDDETKTPASEENGKKKSKPKKDPPKQTPIDERKKAAAHDILASLVRLGILGG